MYTNIVENYPIDNLRAVYAQLSFVFFCKNVYLLHQIITEELNKIT